MFTLDMRTALTAAVISEIISLLVIGVLWYQNHRKFKGLSFWLADYSLQFVGILLIALRNIIPDWASIVLANGLIITGIFLLAVGLRRFVNKKMPAIVVASFVTLLLCVLFVQIYFTYIRLDLTSRNINVTSALLLTFGTAWWATRWQAKTSLDSTRLVRISLGLIMLICVTRIIGFIIAPQISNDFLNSGLFDDLSFLVLQASTVLLTFFMVLMVNRRLIGESNASETRANVSESEINAVFNSTTIGFAILRNRVFEEINEAACKMLGYTRDELIGQDTSIIYPSLEEYNAAGKLYSQITENNSAAKDVRFRQKNGIIINVSLALSALDKTNLSKGVVLSVIDITENRQTELALMESEARYRRLAENAQDIIYRYRLHPVPCFEYVSPAVEIFTGYSPAEYYADPAMVVRNVFPDDRHQTFDFEDKPPGSFKKSIQIRLVKKDGSIIWTEHRRTPIYDEQDKLVAVEGIARDISENIAMQKSLMESEDNFSTSLNESPLGIRIISNDGKDLYANQTLLDMLGYGCIDELEEMPLTNLYTTDTAQQSLDRREKRLRGEAPPETYRVQLIDKRGHERTFEVFQRTVKWNSGKNFQLLYNDITERVQAEKELVSQAKFPLENPYPVLRVDSTGTLIFANGAAKDILDNWNTHVNEKVPPIWQAHIKTALSKMKTSELEAEYNNVIYSLVLAPIKNAGYVNIYGRDLTAERTAQWKLSVSEQNFRNSLDQSPLGIFIVADGDKPLYVNNVFLDIFGYRDMSEVSMTPVYNWYSRDGYAGFLERRQTRLDGTMPSVNYELEIKRRDGTTRYLEVFHRPILWSGRLQAQIIYRDVTEMKLAQKAVRDNETRYHELVETIPSGLAVYEAVDGGIDFRFKEFNHTAELIEKVNRKEIIGKTVTEVFPGIREMGLLNVFRRVWNSGKSEYSEPVIYIDHNSPSWRENWVYKLPSGEIVAVYNDITSRKHDENLLRETSQSFQSIFENSYDAILQTNTDGQVLAANKAACRMFGYTESEICERGRKGLVDVTDPRLLTAISQRQQTGEFHGELIFIKSDGTKFDGELSSRLYDDASGKPYTTMIIRDITERKNAEIALRMSEQNFRNSLDTSPVGTAVYDNKSKIVYANRSFLDIIGYKTVAEYEANPPEKRYTPESYAGFIKRLDSVRHGDITPINFEMNIFHKDGSLRTVQVFRNNVIWEGKQHFLAQQLDITQRKKDEAEIREFNQQMQAIMNDSPVGILIVDKSGIIQTWNPACERIYGWSEEEVIGKFPPYIPATDFIKARNNRKRILSGQIYTREFHRNRKDGSPLYIGVASAPLKNEYGVPDRILSIVEDITPRKEAEQHILHLNSVLGALRGINQLITLEKNPVRLTKKSCEMLVKLRGYETAWILMQNKLGKITAAVSAGIPAPIFTPIVRSSKSGAYPPCIDELFKEPKAFNVCPRLGSRHPACPIDEMGKNLGNLSGKLEYEGRVYGVLSVQLPYTLACDDEEQQLFRELTGDIAFALDRIEKTEQLDKAEEKARETDRLLEIDRMRAELLANVSHELKTPLTAIKGFTSTLLRSDISWTEPEKQDFLETIDSEADRLTRLISDLLDMSRIDAKAMVLKKEPVSVNEIISGIKSHLDALTEKHRLEIALPKILPFVVADELRIGQVLSNLVDNSVKHSPQGSLIAIKARRAGERVVISVTDRGEGIASEHLNKIFERFYQVTAADKSKNSGTGLGLSICRGIIEGHGGKIWAESELNKGSTFSFSLPLFKGVIC